MDVRNKLSKVFKVLRKIILNLEILIYTQINYQSTVRIKYFLICITQKIHLSPFNLLKIYLNCDNGTQESLELTQKYNGKKSECNSSAKGQRSSGPY